MEPPAPSKLPSSLRSPVLFASAKTRLAQGCLAEGEAALDRAFRLAHEEVDEFAEVEIAIYLVNHLFEAGRKQEAYPFLQRAYDLAKDLALQPAEDDARRGVYGFRREGRPAGLVDSG